MMKTFLTLILTGLISLSMAQPPQDGSRLESAKIGLITQRLNLSSDQAQQFWPLYNELNQKKKDLKVERAKAAMDLQLSSISDERARELIGLNLDIKQRDLDLEKEYMAKFQKVLSPKQTLQLIKVEEDFRKMLLQKFRERQQRQGGGR